MTSPSPLSPVERWFGPRFTDLHPLLQQLHRRGGQLSGTVEVVMPGGLNGHIGRVLARKMSVPGAGLHPFSVAISHGTEGLHWDRCFDGRTEMKSLFEPVGTQPLGHWVERSGEISLHLGVDVIDGAWHWRFLRARWRGWPVPQGLLPRSTAFKAVEGGRYRFYVGFALPLLGTVLSYSGLLDVQPEAG